MLYPQENEFRSLKDLSGVWKFSLDPEDLGEEKNWFDGLPSSRPIGVPGSWNEQYQDTMFYMGTAWHQTDFCHPPEWRGKRTTLRFGAAGHYARVWLNGEFIGEHEGGSLPFEFDISARMEPGRRNRLVVRVNNQLGPETIPPGGLSYAGEKKGDDSDFVKEAIANFASVVPEIQMLPLLLEMRKQYPSVPFDFFPYGGIHRPVKLCATAREHIEKIKVWTEMKRGRASVYCEVAVHGNATAVRATLSRGKKSFAAESSIEDGLARLVIPVPKPDMWHPDSPHLYHLEIRILKKTKIVDEYHTHIGIRTIEVTDNQILLNGAPVYLRGVCKHEDFPVIGRGLSTPVVVKDFSLMKWLGANSFRTSHYPYAEECLMLADQMGFLVIDEMPSVGLDYKMYNDPILEKCKSILTELIDRDTNHPSVVMWSIANEPDVFTESAGEFFGKLCAHAKELDPSRPVTLASMHSPVDHTMEVVDVICINRYYGWYTEPGQIELGAAKLGEELDRIHRTHKKPVLVSEFGADTVAGLHSDPPEIFTEEYQAAFLKAYIDVIRSKEFTIGEHIWNLVDFKTPQCHWRTVLNRKGLFTRDRQPKLAAHLIRQLWQSERHI